VCASTHARSHCAKASAKYQDCKATCGSCGALAAAIKADTGLQVRRVVVAAVAPAA
jgi:Zn finger protein HypA/HybF involved in hydrogenase expression